MPRLASDIGSADLGVCAAPATVPDLSDLSHLNRGSASAPTPRDRLGGWIGLAAAAALHAAVLLAFLTADPPEPYGGGGQWLEAISVEVVPASAIESRDAPQPTTAAGASGPIAPDDGEEAKVEAHAPSAKSEDAPAEHKVETLRAEEALREPEPDAAAAKADQPRQERADTQPEPHTRGGVAALTPESTAAPAAARASASPGAVQRYAMQVRTALARNKPNGRGTRGTAIVTFNISASGSVSFAHVSDTSGNSALDKAAQAAVLRTSFPVPPHGMTENQLTYVVPFHFK